MDRLQEISKMYNVPMEQLVKNLSETNDLVKMQMQIKHEKTILKLISLAEIVEV